MAGVESPLKALEAYLPVGAFPRVEALLVEHRVHLTITRSRASILGDYRHATAGRTHRISVNGNLNPYAFLITLLHELAHLLTFVSHGNSVSAHGREWKRIYAMLLHEFMVQGLFPEAIRAALETSIRNPAASSCADDGLMRVLRAYDVRHERACMVEELPPGALFEIRGGRCFRRGDVLRKRIKCTEESTGRVYLFSPVYEVLRREG